MPSIFYPYLYYPTVRVIGRARAPTVLHPAAHDEPALQLPVFPGVFAAADGLVFQTEAERDIVQRMFPVAHPPPTPARTRASTTRTRLTPTRRRPSPARARAAMRPIWSASDGSTGQGDLDCWPGCSRPTRHRHPGPLRLVLAGPVVDAPPRIPTSTWSARCPRRTSGSSWPVRPALVSPSPWEAFSLVVAEAWSARTPVLVNAGCAATVEHCRRSGGGLSLRWLRRVRGGRRPAQP